MAISSVKDTGAISEPIKKEKETIISNVESTLDQITSQSSSVPQVIYGPAPPSPNIAEELNLDFDSVQDLSETESMSNSINNNEITFDNINQFSLEDGYLPLEVAEEIGAVEYAIGGIYYDQEGHKVAEIDRSGNVYFSDSEMQKKYNGQFDQKQWMANPANSKDVSSQQVTFDPNNRIVEVAPYNPETAPIQQIPNATPGMNVNSPKSK